MIKKRNPIVISMNKNKKEMIIKSKKDKEKYKNNWKDLDENQPSESKDK